MNTKTSVSLETSYMKMVSTTHRKKYGQYFTPTDIADLMATWICSHLSDDAKILDPAIGLGIFFRSISNLIADKQKNNIHFYGYDIDEHLVNQSAKELHNLTIDLYHQDFLTSNWEESYDSIICNPPYIKFRDYDNKEILLNTFVTEMNMKPSGFANLYILFLLKSLNQLKPGGRAAFIIPSEFLNSDYGIQIKQYLLENKLLKMVIIVDLEQQLFENAITTSAVFLFEKSDELDEIEFLTIKKEEDLIKLNDYIRTYPTTSTNRKGKVFPLDKLDANKKWRMYYQEENSKKYRNLRSFSDFAKASRGIATGANDFFTFNKTKQQKHNIDNKFLIPCLTKSSQVSTSFFLKQDYDRLVESDKPVSLLNVFPEDLKDPSLHRYIQLGQENGYHNRYLTKTRKPWYKNEKRNPAPILVGVFNRNRIKFIRNEAGVLHLTAFHCVYLLPKYEHFTELLMAYLLTDVAQELLNDYRRDYGNGLKKFEPNDINQSFIADLDLLNSSQIDTIHSLYLSIRAKQLVGEDTKIELVGLNTIFLQLLQ
ncbi:HsdM family class I SAM-dependent methyltransferase [Aquibacillus kalidii]|uniref:HsdM family class I SAM-dependent methyltransferase n=1 Tax=Aquibacillus kalidii TaxID=2762597 RepID=UPI0016446885|nr:N-6 DNA methylase [Aquibacillus kalidii]